MSLSATGEFTVLRAASPGGQKSLKKAHFLDTTEEKRLFFPQYRSLSYR